MIPELPWYAWSFGVIFWTLVGFKVHTRSRGDDGAPGAGGSEDGPRWSGFRGGF